MKIRIADRFYTVEFVEPEDCEAEGIHGWCDFDDCAICIKRGMDGIRTRDVMLHEVMHGLWHEHGFPARQPEEETVTFMARALSAFFTANKGFTREYLM